MTDKEILSKKDVDVTVAVSGRKLDLWLDDGKSTNCISVELAPKTNPIKSFLKNWKKSDQSPEEDFCRRFNKSIRDLEYVVSELKKHRNTYPYDQNARKEVEGLTKDLKRTTETLNSLSTEVQNK